MENKFKITEYKKEDALTTIDRNIIWINSADNKSSILLGVYSFILGGSIFLFDTSIIQQINDERLIWLRLILALAGLTMSFAILVIPVLLILAILTKTKEKQKKSNKNITFFEDIASKSYDEFKATVKNIDESEIYDDLISHVYMTSKIASRKYRLLKSSYTLLALFFLAAIIYSFIFTTYLKL